MAADVIGQQIDRGVVRALVAALSQEAERFIPGALLELLDGLAEQGRVCLLLAVRFVALPDEFVDMDRLFLATCRAPRWRVRNRSPASCRVACEIRQRTPKTLQAGSSLAARLTVSPIQV